MALDAQLTAFAQAVGDDMARRPPVVVLTQAAYDLITPDPATVYIIVPA